MYLEQNYNSEFIQVYQTSLYHRLSNQLKWSNVI